MKPPFTYFGGKTGIAPQIAALLPPHEHYVEPFAGSLAVLLAKRPSGHETVNDLDGGIMTFWRVLRDRPAELERVCTLTPHSRTEYAASYEPCDGELEQARRTWVRLTQSRARTTAAVNQGWRYHQAPLKTSSAVPDYLDAYVSRLAEIARRLRHVSLECLPALELIRDYGRHEGVLVYADPPYLGSARRGSVRYAAEMPGEDDHRYLAATLSACRGAVVLSGYDSPLYAELYDGWHRREIRAHTGNGKGGTARTEALWSNRPFAQGSLFDLEDAKAPPESPYRRGRPNARPTAARTKPRDIP